MRDFQRVPNSITRQALPEGAFKGKSKQVWDYLWSISRGAINPTRIVRKSRAEIRSGSGLGSMVTVDAALLHLKTVGLVQVRPAVGSLSGNEYEIFTPEEVQRTSTSSTSSTSTSSTTSPTQKVVVLDVLETGISSTTQPALESIAYHPPNTSFKTDDDDTHTLRELVDPLLEAARAVCVGELKFSEQERERWRELGQLLGEELKQASERTGAISSVPAFLTAHLKRRLSQRTRPPSRGAEGARPESQRPGVTERTETDGGTGEASPTANSKFSLETCMRYAEHLYATGQGVTNPGGFAMSIYRSGAADALIEKFREPHPEARPIDASKCPNCRGTGFYYPGGIDQGVVKCRHESLLAGEDTRILTAPRPKNAELGERGEFALPSPVEDARAERAKKRPGRTPDAEDRELMPDEEK